MKHCDLPHELQEKYAIDMKYSPPALLVECAPHVSDFWNFNSNGEEVSALGFFPLCRGISRRQYDALLETQQHLKDLKMIHSLESVEILSLTNDLVKLLERSHKRDLVSALVMDLSFGEISIYTGLDTGFSLPGDTAHAWGLSSSEHHGKLDFFISQKAPSVASAVLHLYLAHRGVPRGERYEEEFCLERINSKVNEELQLPNSIRTEISASSNAELLFLLEQVKVSDFDHPFAAAIRDTCISLLVTESSRLAWVDAHSRGFLEGSISARELLQQRLDIFASRGARQLPSIDNLSQLFRTVDSIVSDALFMADRHRLDTLMGSLLAVYHSSDSSVDINADLFALMFFCALRKHAFETVYLETTDRCPFFLTQPDQAAVFSELWVLGSQCDIYFGILPRALGSIIHNKYRAFLREHPPPANAFNGTEVFTTYSFTHISDETIGPKQDNDQQPFRSRIMELGALSIFCMPAIVDVCLLTFVGRGFFLAVSMDLEDRLMAAYALLSALLIAAGNTGWVGSVGGHYLHNVSFRLIFTFYVPC
jgi:hypothetical protein